MQERTECAEDRILPPHDPVAMAGQRIAPGGLVVLSSTLDPELLLQETMGRQLDLRLLDINAAVERAMRVEALRCRIEKNERLFEPGELPRVQEDRATKARKRTNGKRR